MIRVWIYGVKELRSERVRGEQGESRGVVLIVSELVII